MPWATVAKAIIEVASNTAANVFDIMALSDFLWRALFGTNRKSLRRQPANRKVLRSNQNLQITNGSDTDGQVSF
jgi:hypothetical protein